MSRAYKFHKPDGLYFITFATVDWIDVFTRRDYLALPKRLREGEARTSWSRA